MKDASALERIEAFMRHDQERRQLYGTAGRLDCVVDVAAVNFAMNTTKMAI